MPSNPELPQLESDFSELSVKAKKEKPKFKQRNVKKGQGIRASIKHDLDETLAELNAEKEKERKISAAQQKEQRKLDRLLEAEQQEEQRRLSEILDAEEQEYEAQQERDCSAEDEYDKLMSIEELDALRHDMMLDKEEDAALEEHWLDRARAEAEDTVIRQVEEVRTSESNPSSVYRKIIAAFQEEIEVEACISKNKQPEPILFTSEIPEFGARGGCPPARPKYKQKERDFEKEAMKKTKYKYS